MRRLEPKSTVVVMVDVQERLASAMPSERMVEVTRAARILIESARLLGAPVFVTEQYPQGLGPTLPELGELSQAAGATRFEKTTFSAVGAKGFLEAVKLARVSSAVVLGMESHVCVFQTVRDLVGSYLDVHVVSDGVCSRRDDHREVGLRLAERAGGILTTAESVVFDWLGAAGSEAFKQVSRLVR